MKEKTLINDDRLTPTMERIRSGRTQQFREKNPKDRTFINKDNCDVSLEHERREMYAELIDGQWYWVSGCAECNGEPRDWMSYIECEEHDRCRACGINRKDITETPWGGKSGWICKPCQDARDLQTRRAAFEEFNDKEYDEWDFMYQDQIKCPHCGTDLGCDDVYESTEMDCYVCGGEMEVEVNVSFSYTTSVKGERITE